MRNHQIHQTLSNFFIQIFPHSPRNLAKQPDHPLALLLDLCTHHMQALSSLAHRKNT